MQINPNEESEGKHLQKDYRNHPALPLNFLNHIKAKEEERYSDNSPAPTEDTCRSERENSLKFFQKQDLNEESKEVNYSEENICDDPCIEIKKVDNPVMLSRTDVKMFIIQNQHAAEVRLKELQKLEKTLGVLQDLFKKLEKAILRGKQGLS